MKFNFEQKQLSGSVLHSVGPLVMTHEHCEVELSQKKMVKDF